MDCAETLKSRSTLMTFSKKVDFKGVSDKIELPLSKSYVQRFLIGAFLAGELEQAIVTLNTVARADSIEDFADDIQVAIKALEELNRREVARYGAMTTEVSTCEVSNCEVAEIDCEESGAVLRMLMPAAAALGKDAIFYRADSLAKRPMDTFISELEKHGIRFNDVVSAECDYNCPAFGEGPDMRIRNELRSGLRNGLKISGQLQPDAYRLPGNISSQFVSGLLFALPLLDGDSTLGIEGELQSAPYVEMTINALKMFGVVIDVVNSTNQEKTNSLDAYKETSEDCDVEKGRNIHPYSFSVKYIIKGNQKYRYSDDCLYLLERDWSAAAMWLAADYLQGGGIEFCGFGDGSSGINLESLQGDRIIVEYLERIKAGKAGQIIELDVSDCPDIAPCIALAAVKADCDTKLINAARLRMKECDRLAAIVRILNQLGADVEEGEDWLLVHGSGLKDGELLAGSDDVIDTCGDHRMVMMAALASIITKRPVLIDNVESVKKSYPGFFDSQKVVKENRP